MARSHLGALVHSQPSRDVIAVQAITTVAMASESFRTDATQPVTDPHGAEQPARKKRASGTTVVAEQLATAAHDASKDTKASALITTLEQCATWMSSVTTHEANEPLRRLSEALHVLHAQPSRPRRCQIQSMLKSWDVPQKDKSGAKIRASDIEAMLKRKVLDEARRLKTLHDAHGSSRCLGRTP